MPGITKQGAPILRSIWQHPANRGHRLRSIVYALAWQVYKRLLRKGMDISFHSLKFRCYPDSTIASSIIYFNGLPDYNEMKFMRHFLRPGDGFVDVGANIGVYAILASSLVGNDGTVHAFEPNPRVFERLRENCDLNGLTQMKVYPLAVGEERGSIGFNINQCDALSHIDCDGGGQGKVINVECQTLDNVLAGQVVAMGKMDIEGAELLALNGAQGMLSNMNPPVWQLELAGYSNKFGSRSDEIVSWLADRGFDTAIYLADSRQLRLTSAPWEYGVDNVLAIARTKIESVLRRIDGTIVS